MGSVIELLVRLVVSMGAVMAVMGLAARFVRRRQGSGPLLAGRRAPATAPAGRPGRARPRRSRPVAPLEILYRRPLSKGAAVSLVEAAGRTFLLGVTDHSVTVLAELPDGPAATGPAATGPTNAGRTTALHPSAGQLSTGQGFAGQGFAGQGFAGQGFAGQGFAGQGFAGQGPASRYS